MISADLLEYIVGLLLGPIYTDGDGPRRQYFSLIRYTNDLEEMQDAHVVIKPSGFFDLKNYGMESAEPQLPLPDWEGVPLLFGEPKYEWINEGNTLLLHADLIASTYYLISRYEEMTHRKDRDSFGRFPGKSSLPYRAGFIHRPVIDEYGLALRRFLDQHGVFSQAGLISTDLGSSFCKIKLTHDIYRPFKYQGLSGIVRGIFFEMANPFKVIRTVFSSPEQDPYYTYDRIFQLDREVMDNYELGVVQSVLFMRVPSEHILDSPNYSLLSSYMYHVLSEADKIGSIFGLLCSHRSATKPRAIPEEMKSLRSALTKIYRRLYGWFDCKDKREHSYRQDQKCQRDLELTRSRHSSLALGEPEDVRELLTSGIRHDYSMGYADVMGFRLGTSRPVRFINPNTRELTDLTMHPISLNAVSLIDSKVSGFTTEEEAYRYCTSVIDQVHRVGGELNLSWQTDLFAEEVHPWAGRVYARLIRYLIDTYGTVHKKGSHKDQIALN